MDDQAWRICVTVLRLSGPVGQKYHPETLGDGDKPWRRGEEFIFLLFLLSESQTLWNLHASQLVDLKGNASTDFLDPSLLHLLKKKLLDLDIFRQARVCKRSVTVP